MSLLDRFYGNDKAKEALVFYQRDGRFPHGILLEGTEGSGRKTFARLIAAAALCEGENPPCGQCPPLPENSQRHSSGCADYFVGTGKEILFKRADRAIAGRCMG